MISGRQQQTIVIILALLGSFALTLPAQEIERLEVYPQNVKMEVGTVIRFVSVAYGKKGLPLPVRPQWSVGGGIIRPDGTYIAGPVPGTFRLQVLEPRTQKKATTTITLVSSVPPAPIDRVQINPSLITLREGQQFQFSLIAIQQNSLAFSPACTWSAQGGTITPQGVFTAGHRAGRFTISARLRSGMVGTGKVIVHARRARLASVTVRPARIELQVGHSYQFEATAQDSNGRPIDFTPQWEATGGRITERGYFTAGSKPGIHMVMATDRQTGARGSATVFIVLKKSLGGTAVSRITLKPTNVTLRPGETVVFKAQPLDPQGRRVPAVLRWHVTGGTIQSNGTFRAGEISGTYKVVVRSANGVSQSARVTIVNHPIARLVLTPQRIILTPGEKFRLRATAFNTAGRKIPTGVLNWSASGGAIEPDGTYRAGPQEGAFEIQATSRNGQRATAQVIIREKDTIQKVIISPAKVCVAPGRKVHFSATAYTIDQKSISFFPKWRATGGTIDAQGNYLAGMQPGHYMVTASSHENITGKALVEIKPPTISRLVISPRKVVLTPGQWFPFVAKGYDLRQRQVFCRPQWKATGGRISAQGQYIAGSETGQYRVTIKDPTTGLSDQAQVVIKSTMNYPGKITINKWEVSGNAIYVGGHIQGSQATTLRLAVYLKGKQVRLLASQHVSNEEDFFIEGHFPVKDAVLFMLILQNEQGQVIARHKRLY